MSEEKKEVSTKTLKPADAAKAADAAEKAATKAEEAAQKAIAKAKQLKDAAAKAAEEEFKAIAADIKQEPKGPEYTFKRKTEMIFRRQMGEPEFFLDKDDRFPKPILSDDEKNEITQKALNYEDTTPNYDPKHILDERFGGTSNYETGITVLGDELEAKLQKIKNNPDTLQQEIDEIERRLAYLDSLHENYYLGMNVFRTAKGGRDKEK
tara:strand:- start:8493 stop:9119 length:627 start_codon:yes stop_codon:yes gene_type:complete